MVLQIRREHEHTSAADAAVEHCRLAGREPRDRLACFWCDRRDLPERRHTERGGVGAERLKNRMSRIDGSKVALASRGRSTRRTVRDCDCATQELCYNIAVNVRGCRYEQPATLFQKVREKR